MGNLLFLHACSTLQLPVMTWNCGRFALPPRLRHTPPPYAYGEMLSKSVFPTLLVSPDLFCLRGIPELVRPLPVRSTPQPPVMTWNYGRLALPPRLLHTPAPCTYGEILSKSVLSTLLFPPGTFLLRGYPNLVIPLPVRSTACPRCSQSFVRIAHSILV